MAYSFTAEIYKRGINACVDVPLEITQQMAKKGYIPVKGSINSFSFTQTLCPVRNKPYLLYVNIPMLQGSHTRVGDRVKLTIEIDTAPRVINMPLALKNKLNELELMDAFESLTLSRQKEIKSYLNSLQSEEAIDRNIKKVIKQLNKIKPPNKT